MAKTRAIFVCRACGATQHRWMGKCPDCGAWSSLEQQTHDPSAQSDPYAALSPALAATEGDADGPENPARPLDQIDEKSGPIRRLTSGIHEFDRVLGGQGENLGIVPGSAVLLGGEPGIGKSTLLLQAAAGWALHDHRVLYVSSEESAAQIRSRAQRLAPKDHARWASNVHVLAETNLSRILEQTRRAKPAVLIIDSIQMIYHSSLPAAPGSVTQLRRCAAELIVLAKRSGIAVLLVGHVTKDGAIAGPRLLEHLVDAVLSFEGDRYHSHRVVRGIKNRFGTTLELGLFEMTGVGLEPARAQGSAPIGGGEPRPGCVVCPVMTGSRCLMVEIQALTATGFLGAAKRKSSGLDPNRLAMLVAVLEQHAGLRLADRDIFASSVGGLRIVEPAADLALLLAIAGAHYRKALPKATAVVGEVGLGGEIRPVPQLDARVHEAAKLGYTSLLVPAGARTAAKGIELVRVGTIDRAIEKLDAAAAVRVEIPARSQAGTSHAGKG